MAPLTLISGVKPKFKVRAAAQGLLSASNKPSEKALPKLGVRAAVAPGACVLAPSATSFVDCAPGHRRSERVWQHGRVGGARYFGARVESRAVTTRASSFAAPGYPGYLCEGGRNVAQGSRALPA